LELVEQRVGRGALPRHRLGRERGRGAGRHRPEHGTVWQVCQVVGDQVGHAPAEVAGLLARPVPASNHRHGVELFGCHDRDSTARRRGGVQPTPCRKVDKQRPSRGATVRPDTQEDAMRIHRSAPPIVFAIALLAACGGPASAPAKPSATGVSPDFVARGETFTVTGTGFGTSGTVTVGGVVASVSSWSDTAIEATVPAAAPGAWQEVEVTTAGGSSKVAGPFVGVAYEGDAADLPDFLASQSPGTA